MCKMERRKRRGDNMSVFAKPVNLAFRVSKEKSKEFFDQKPDNRLLIKKFDRLKRTELRAGKKASDKEIIALTKEIERLKKKLDQD